MRAILHMFMVFVSKVPPLTDVRTSFVDGSQLCNFDKGSTFFSESHIKSSTVLFIDQNLCLFILVSLYTLYTLGNLNTLKSFVKYEHVFEP